MSGISNLFAPAPAFSTAATAKRASSSPSTWSFSELLATQLSNQASLRSGQISGHLPANGIGYGGKVMNPIDVLPATGVGSGGKVMNPIDVLPATGVGSAGKVMNPIDVLPANGAGYGGKIMNPIDVLPANGVGYGDRVMNPIDLLPANSATKSKSI